MIGSLIIQNIALIDKLETELGSGLNILSGETGAGKSIIIDSLNFVLGERADRSLIRYGTDFATVEVVFSDYQTPAVLSYLDEIGADADEILIIRRKMTVDGKNECRINGKPATLSMLKGLTELLVDIHGQHEHQSLLNVSTHINLLDSLAQEETSAEKAECAKAHRCYAELKREQSELGNAEDRARRLDILGYQLKEIENADVQEEEEQELLDKRKRVRNQEKILSALNGAKEALDGYDATAVTSVLKTTAATLDTVSDFDREIADFSERLTDCKEEISDIARGVSSLINQLDFDSRSAEELEERLEKVRTIQRKYGGSYDALQQFLKSAQAEFDKLNGAEERVGEIEIELSKAEKSLLSAAKKLSTTRKRVAEKFEKDILTELNDLGMSGSTFKVQMLSAENAEGVTANGSDSVEFLISPNRGEPLKPLAKIISGGEMSRFMLALKNIVADIDGIGTMVFDEIDTGISGNISAVVAEKMCNISAKRQVIAVTHMPSLAAMADRHYLIAKAEKDGKTLTHLDLMPDDTEEIARLIGGKDYSDFAIPHAREMKAWAERYKKSIGKH